MYSCTEERKPGSPGVARDESRPNLERSRAIPGADPAISFDFGAIPSDPASDPAPLGGATGRMSDIYRNTPAERPLALLAGQIISLGCVSSMGSPKHHPGRLFDRPELRSAESKISKTGSHSSRIESIEGLKGLACLTGPKERGKEKKREERGFLHSNGQHRVPAHCAGENRRFGCAGTHFDTLRGHCAGTTSEPISAVPAHWTACHEQITHFRRFA